MYNLILLAFACGGNPPTSEPAEPPDVQVAAFESTKTESTTEHDNHEHGSATVDPGPITEGASVSFVEPQDGASLKSPVKVVMNVEGMTVQPAGELKDGTGHHHLIIDTDPVPKGTAVTSDDQHIHFGKGQTETELVLAPGSHKIQLQFANGAHISYGEQLSSTITITVTE